MAASAGGGAGPIRLGIAPIGWSNDDLPELGGNITLEQCLREARAAGYVGVEKGGKFPMDAKVLGPVLEDHGLKLVSGWFWASCATAASSARSGGSRSSSSSTRRWTCR